MKSLGNGIILRSKTATAVECLHYALNLPTSLVITGIDSMAILDQAFDAARTYRPLGEMSFGSAAREDGEGRRARRIRALQDELHL